MMSLKKRLDMRDIYPIHGTLIRNNDDQPVDLGITYFQKKTRRRLRPVDSHFPIPSRQVSPKETWRVTFGHSAKFKMKSSSVHVFHFFLGPWSAFFILMIEKRTPGTIHWSSLQTLYRTFKGKTKNTPKNPRYFAPWHQSPMDPSVPSKYDRGMMTRGLAVPSRSFSDSGHGSIGIKSQKTTAPSDS